MRLRLYRKPRICLNTSLIQSEHFCSKSHAVSYIVSYCRLCRREDLSAGPILQKKRPTLPPDYTPTTRNLI
jgi:hypothetical protein